MGKLINSYLYDDLKLKQLNIKRIINTYNKIMMDIGKEYNTIATKYSEGTECWNLRDLVAECDYVLSLYYEEGTVFSEIKDIDYKLWKSETDRLKRFIKNYSKYIDFLECNVRHCSIYD